MVSTISAYLTSHEILEYQVGVILFQVCPQVEDPYDCVAQLPAFWSRIALVLWPGYYSPEAEWMCGSGAGSAKSVTCDECLDGIQASIDQLFSGDFVSGIVAALSGDGFCGMEEDAKLIESTIEVFIPLALLSLFTMSLILVYT